MDLEAKIMEHEREISALKSEIQNIKGLIDNGFNGVRTDLQEIKGIFGNESNKQLDVNKDLYEKYNLVYNEANKRFSSGTVVIISVLVGVACSCVSALVTILASSK